MDADMIVSLIRRHMRESPRFVRHENGNQLAGVVPSDAEEIVVGHYDNPPPWQSERVIFTSGGLWVTHGADMESLRWKDIQRFESPDSTWRADSVVIHTSSGSKVVHMAGTHGPGGKFKDVFALVMVLRAIVSG